MVCPNNIFEKGFFILGVEYPDMYPAAVTNIMSCLITKRNGGRFTTVLNNVSCL